MAWRLTLNWMVSKSPNRRWTYPSQALNVVSFPPRHIINLLSRRFRYSEHRRRDESRRGTQECVRHEGGSCRATACVVVWLAICSLAQGAEYKGEVVFNGLPVPGATITATRDHKKLTAVTDDRGFYSFADLADGKWTVEVGMTGFSTIKQDVTIAPETPEGKWELKLLPADELEAAIKQPALVIREEKTQQPSPPADNPAEPPPPGSDLTQDTSEGLLINGSVNNAASSPFKLAGAFGNNRRGPRA